jgi:hypothetical protein
VIQLGDQLLEFANDVNSLFDFNDNIMLVVVHASEGWKLLQLDGKGPTTSRKVCEYVTRAGTGSPIVLDAGFRFSLRLRGIGRMAHSSRSYYLVLTC